MKLVGLLVCCLVAVAPGARTYPPGQPKYLGPYYPNHRPNYPYNFYPPYFAQHPSQYPYFGTSSDAASQLSYALQALRDSASSQGTSEDQEQESAGEGIQARTFFYYPKLYLRAQVYATHTKYTITTSTLTLTSAMSCIPFASFYGGSTQSCRRKRDSAYLKAAIDAEDANGSLLHPTPVENVQATANVDAQRLRSVDVESSLTGPDDGSRQQRQYIFGFTTTVQLTSYTISTTAYKTTIRIGSNISCLPSGFSVC